MCLRDHAASREVIDATRSHLGPRTMVVNLTTGSPEEAVALANHAATQGISYITGAIMVPTPLIGTDDCLVLYAGQDADFAAAGPTIRALGGVADHVGTDHGRPPVLDMAMLGICFAGMYSFLHSAAMARYGIDRRSTFPMRRASSAPCFPRCRDSRRPTRPGTTPAARRDSTCA